MTKSKKMKKIAIIVLASTVFSITTTVVENAAFMQALNNSINNLDQVNIDAYALKKEPMQVYIEDNSNYIASTNVRADAVKVPDKYKNTFILELTLTNNNPKIFSSADSRTELNATIAIPEKLYTKDLNVYNGHYFRVNDEENNSTYFVDMNDTTWRTISDSKLQVVGIGTERMVVSREKNRTMELNARTNYTAEELRNITAGTGLEGIEEALVAAENKYGVNSVYILSVAIHESGWGSSYLARVHNNLFGICAFDSNLDAASSFASKEECVDYFARLMKNEYFPEGRTTLESVNAIYASNGAWANEVHSSMSSILNHI